jgi:hypothetical protein
MQLAIQRTDQSKLFPLIVLLQYAGLPYASHCAILGMLCPDSDILRRPADGHVLRKFRPSPGNQLLSVTSSVRNWRQTPMLSSPMTGLH